MDDPAEGPDVSATPETLAGVWANDVLVTLGEQEFTLDFIRLDYSTGSPPQRGVHVARVACGPLLVTRLLDELDRAWQSYAETTMPKEVRGDDGPEGLEAEERG